MLGIREKLSLGFGGLFLIIVMIGVQSILQLTKLGYSIDVILRENYLSVLASQQMQNALERMDSGTLFTLLGENEQGRALIAGSKPDFEKALQAELNNITLPEEAGAASQLKDLFEQYRGILQEVQNPALLLEARKETYFTKLLPLFHQIKGTAGTILQMNQQNMMDANARARTTAATARQRMYVLLVFGAAVAVVFILFTRRWILRPIHRLTQSADEIRRGNLDLVVQSDSRDEIGRLSQVFNEMASSLREFRRNDRTRMDRIQRSTRQVFKGLPDAVAVVDPEGRVEVATEAAAEIFGLKPDVQVRGLAFDWIESFLDEALWNRRTAGAHGGQPVIQRFVKGEEHFFSPEAVPILDGEKNATGVILILKDVTRELHQDELKRGVVSTVSHQLKTPLTSLRMAIYLLLEEKVGPLTPKQMELLVAARDDSDRLHSILSNLLDISRIESGRMQMDLRPISPHEMVVEQVDLFRSAAKDRGLTLEMEMPDDLPEVQADTTRIGHVLGNLLSNAIKYTSPGGEIRISAEASEGKVCFRVSDTGRGIPAAYLDRVFEQFFRVPDQDGGEGEGLGLAITKEIVEAHGGTIGVESTEGQGSTFTFCLQRADEVSRKE
jgi:signal transduction histidine kinase